MLIDPQPQPAHLRYLRSRRVWTGLFFYSQWLFVILVSVFDSLLTIHLQDQMMLSELNPMGRALLHLNSGGVGYLIAVKCVGTIAAASIVLMLYWRRTQFGLAVVAGLATFQLGLLLFLVFK